jgi:DNA primase
LVGTLFRRIAFVFISQAKAYLQVADEFKEMFYLRFRSLILFWKDRIRVSSRLGRLRLPRPARPWNTQPMHVYFKSLKSK